MISHLVLLKIRDVIGTNVVLLKTIVSGSSSVKSKIVQNKELAEDLDRWLWETLRNET